jgi:hypothetical protein
MVKVGDQIRLSSMKGSDREGVVTAVTGSLVRVRWQSGGETTLVPAPGTLTVVVAAKAGPQTAANKQKAAKSTAGKEKKTAASKSATPIKQAASTTKAAKRPKR